jgi:hypothetical protein
MKKLSLVAVVILAFASLAARQAETDQMISRQVKFSDRPTAKTDNQALKQTLITLEKQSWEAWKKRDGKFYQEFLSDDHVEVGSSGVATKGEIVPFVGSPICVVKSYAVDKFELTVFDANTALLTYHAAQDTVCHNRVPSPVWVSSLYVRRGGRWLNALYQQTPADK